MSPNHNNKLLFYYRDKIKIVNIFIYCTVVVFVISLLNDKIEWELFLGIQPFLFFISYLDRNSAINISFYEKKMVIKFYLMFKEIEMDYKDVIYFRNCWDRYSGTFIRFKAKHNDKIIYFKIKTYDDDLRRFISENFVNYDNLKR